MQSKFVNLFFCHILMESPSQGESCERCLVFLIKAHPQAWLTKSGTHWVLANWIVHKLCVCLISMCHFFSFVPLTLSQSNTKRQPWPRQAAGWGEEAGAGESQWWQAICSSGDPGERSHGVAELELSSYFGDLASVPILELVRCDRTATEEI